jgi:hypothetical protein
MPELNTKAVGAIGLTAAAVTLGAWQITRFAGSADTVMSAEAAQQARDQADPQARPEGRPDTGPGSASGEDTIADGAPADNDAPANRSVSSGPGGGWLARDPLGEDPARAFSFTEVADASEAAAQLVTAAEALAPAAEAEPELIQMGQPARLDLIDAWRLFVSPLVSGQEDRFAGAVSRLGGVTESEDGGSPASRLFAQLSPVLQNAALDLGAAVVRSVDPTSPGEVPTVPTMSLAAMQAQGRNANRGSGGGGLPPGAVPIMMIANQNTDQATGVQRRDQALEIPLHAVFPDAAERAGKGARTIEVWTPTRMQGQRTDSADIGLSVFMVHDRAARAWQPIALRVRLVSEAAQDRVRDSMRAARAARESSPSTEDIRETRP